MVLFYLLGLFYDKLDISEIPKTKRIKIAEKYLTSYNSHDVERTQHMTVRPRSNQYKFEWYIEFDISL